MPLFLDCQLLRKMSGTLKNFVRNFYNRKQFKEIEDVAKCPGFSCWKLSCSLAFVRISKPQMDHIKIKLDKTLESQKQTIVPCRGSWMECKRCSSFSFHCQAPDTEQTLNWRNRRAKRSRHAATRISITFITLLSTEVLPSKRSQHPIPNSQSSCRSRFLKENS